MQNFSPLNMDYSKTIIMNGDSHQWVQSPIDGVIRCQFEREYSESGWATSLVRYAPGTYFSKHLHPGGEQFYVVEGTFSDDTGDYPADTYVQNPKNSSHTPFSKQGTLIFVRLGATDSFIHSQIVVHNFSQQSSPLIHTGRNDYLICNQEHTNNVFIKHNVELLILRGHIQHQNTCLHPLSWIRIAATDQLSFRAMGQVTYLERHC